MKADCPVCHGTLSHNTGNSRGTTKATRCPIAHERRNEMKRLASHTPQGYATYRRWWLRKHRTAVIEQLNELRRQHG